MDLAGVPCIVSDTAGLRSGSSDSIELEGMRRARYVVVAKLVFLFILSTVFNVVLPLRFCREAFRRAHIKVLVVDGAEMNSINVSNTIVYFFWIRTMLLIMILIFL